VLSLIGKGYSVAQATSALEMSHHTAHDHMRAIYRKLAIASRAEAAIAARDLGLA
jgi:ATP/maltotriose-dependent transcriptional regulator MalT